MAALSPIIDLFEQLHGKQSYIKIVGNPLFSVRALLNEGVSANQTPDPSTLTVFQSVKGQLDLLSDKLAQAAWWKPRKIHEAVRDIDQAALDWAVNDGYLPSAPSAVVVPEKNILTKSRLPALYLEITDEIRMVADHAGHVHLPKHVQNWLAKKTDVPAAISTTSAEQNPSIQRMVALFHEASHHVFSHIKKPFVAPEGFDERAAGYLNDWVFSQRGTNTALKALNEIFADTYGAIMVLRGLDFRQEAIDVVREFAKLRIDMDLVNAMSQKTTLRQKFLSALSKDDENVHVGGQTVLKLLDKIPEWRSLPVDDLEGYALRLSSEGLCDWLRPKGVKVSIDGEEHSVLKLGNKANSLILDNMPKFLDIVTAQLANKRIYQNPRERPNHPCQEDVSFVVDFVCENLSSSEKKSLHQDGIFGVLSGAFSEARAQEKVISTLAKTHKAEFDFRQARFDEKSSRALEVIKTGFSAYYKGLGKKPLVSSDLKGRPLSFAK